jgi:predicted RNase H-like HicB family nuclease
MRIPPHLSVTIEREGDRFVSRCAELDVASQGDTVHEARTNLVEAVELFLETADEQEVISRMQAR